MKTGSRIGIHASVLALVFFAGCTTTNAALSLTSGSNATTTPNVATSIPGFQIVGPSASTTPVKLYSTSGTLAMTTTTGLTFTGASSGSVVYFSGTVENINNALSTLTYTRASTGTDTLEVSLVEYGEVFFTDNNHLYKFITNTLTWNSAKTAAEGQTAYGATGYLATVGSSAENSFISARLSADGWFGASDSGSEGTWKWVTGPETGTTFWNGASGGSVVSGQYANWNSGEPNDSGGSEDCAQYYSASGKWNDLPCSGFTLSGYVVEFGAPGDLPTVVAKNISIVTADVPALTTLSPANASTTVSTSANLVANFSKSVTAGSGSITIRKASDDSIVESIDVTGAQVTGGGTSAITINPSVTLADSTSYYVLVPSTAFKDVSNNYYEGISATSTWTFTTGDFTAPTFSSVTATSTASTTATVTWTTNEAASSRVSFGPTESYGTSTAITNTSPRVTSHSVGLTNLVPCATYYYAVTSTDASSNTATSTASSFVTLGCTAEASTTAATTTAITASSGGSTSLTSGTASLAVSAPSNFTATSSTVVIQVHALPNTTILDTIGVPSSKSRVGEVVFSVKAIIDNVTELDSFDAPVTITYTYADADVAGLDESTLKLYHYHDNAWDMLDDCSVTASSNTITCTTPSFSLFSLFGEPAVSGKSTDSIQSRVKRLTSMGKATQAASVKAAWPQLFGQTAVASTSAYTRTNSVFTRDLYTGVVGEDVRALQQYLNTHGYVLATTGPGSPGNETTRFGALTRAAVRALQTANGIAPSAGYVGPRTRAWIETHP